MNIETRLLTQRDADLLDAFLAPHTAEAYYLRSNAKGGGLDYHGQYLQGEYFGAFKGDALLGTICYSWSNNILVYASDEVCLPALVRAVEPALLARGGKLNVLLGLKPLAEGVIGQLGLTNSDFASCDQEGLFTMDLADLTPPALAPDHFVRPAREADKELLIQWRMAFNIESVAATPGAELEASVREEIECRLNTHDFFILEKAGKPIAFCGVGGCLTDMMMVGPVWTPPEERCRGYARAVTGWALKLQQAASNGALKAGVLFASRPDAIKAYERLGFRRIADWNLSFLKDDYRWKPKECTP